MTQAPIATPKQAPEGTPTFEIPKQRPKRRSFPWRAIVAVVLILAAGGTILAMTGTFGSSASESEELLFTVKRGELRIDVVESGSLESGNSISIKSELEGRPQILRLVDEGTFVKKGTILCELDASDLVEREMSQEISFEKAKATFVAAQKDHEIRISNGESDIKQAELNVYFAEMDLKKFQEGDWPQSKRKAETDITIAEEELKRADDRLVWSKKLNDRGFITRQDLEADQLAVTKQDIKLTLAKESMRVLQDYTYERDMATLESAHEEAQKELDRVIKRVEGENIRSEADLKSKEATYDLERERLEKMRDQIAKAKIIAPQDGLVVYNNSSSGFGRSNQEPIQEGSTVRERQTIFKLPDVTNMIAKIKIHESSYDRVREGLRCFVTLDAFQDRRFPARLTFVAPLADSQQWWMNPDLKVYSAEVKLGGDTTMLKPGMSCSVEIEVDNLEDVLSAPMQSVFRKGSTNFCYAKTADGIVAKPVLVGLHNDKMIHIKEGLEAGDQVLLAPPPNAADIDVPEVEVERDVEAEEDMEFPEYNPEKKKSSGGDSISYEAYLALPDEEKRGAFMKLSAEDRQKAMKSFMSKMSPEQRERMESAMKNFGGDSGGGGRPGGGGGGGRPGGGRPGGGRGDR